MSDQCTVSFNMIRARNAVKNGRDMAVVDTKYALVSRQDCIFVSIRARHNRPYRSATKYLRLVWLESDCSKC